MFFSLNHITCHIIRPLYDYKWNVCVFIISNNIEIILLFDF